MKITVRKATMQDLDAIKKIYDNLHTAEENGIITTGWVRGVPVCSVLGAASGAACSGSLGALGSYSLRISSRFRSRFSITPPPYAFAVRCRRVSYMKIPAATEAFREVILPHMGNRSRKSHFSRTSLPMPKPSEPITRATGPVRSTLS